MLTFRQAAQHVGAAELTINENPGRRNWASFDMIMAVFVYLQSLDVMTTLLGFELGASEASPFIRILMFAGPRAGVLISKLVALGLAAACLWLGKRHVLRWANYWYAALVLWNLLVTLAAASRFHS
jgi:hypothetical protein